MNEWREGRKEGRMDGRKEEWMEGRMDGRLRPDRCLEAFTKFQYIHSS